MNLNMLKRWYRGNEWKVGKDPKRADYIIVATCGFSKTEEDTEIAAIERLLNEKKKDCELIITGCLPQINKERVREVFDGKCVKIVDMQTFNSIMNFDKKIEAFDNHFVSEEEYDTDPEIYKYFKARKRFEKFSFLPLVRVPKILYTVPSEKWFLIRCAMGCTGNCTYCGIRHALGKIKSDPIQDILDQAKKAIVGGYEEISLTGEDQGGYGVDFKSDLSVLLTELINLPGKFKINLRYIDPFWLIRLKDKLLPIFQTGRVTAFCTPAQSGSNRILKAMNRRYTFEELKSTVNHMVHNSKLGLISTNIIVGFPGETEEDFKESLRLIDEIDFGVYLAFKYQDRPGTRASELSDKVPDKVIQRRYDEIQSAIKKKHFRFALKTSFS
jgi:threonylcarbamoyladenosine tRNA methylthiotransferase CDKAL1